MVMKRFLLSQWSGFVKEQKSNADDDQFMSGLHFWKHDLNWSALSHENSQIPEIPSSTPTLNVSSLNKLQILQFNEEE